MIGHKVKNKSFSTRGTVKATHKEGGEVCEVLVEWGQGNLTWERPSAGQIEIFPPEVPNEKTG